MLTTSLSMRIFSPSLAPRTNLHGSTSQFALATTSSFRRPHLSPAAKREAEKGQQRKEPTHVWFMSVLTPVMYMPLLASASEPIVSTSDAIRPP